MAADGEQTRRSRRTTARNTGSYDPLPLVMNPRHTADVSSQTGNYRFDEGMTDPPRSHTSVVRFNNTSDMRSQRSTTSSTSSTNSRPITPPTTPRRQGMPKELPPNRNTAQQPLRNTVQQPNRNTAQYPIRSATTTAPRTRQPRMAPPQPPGTEKIKHRGVDERKQATHKVHWLVPTGVGMVFMLVLWVIASTILAWGTDRYNDFHYGVPRTYQTDAIVGHNNDSQAKPSHFIAMNLNHQAIVIEIMAGDPAKSVSYVAPIVIYNDDLAPVTVDFKDVNGDHKADMIIRAHLKIGEKDYIFINTGDKFRPSNNNDKIQGV